MFNIASSILRNVISAFQTQMRELLTHRHVLLSHCVFSPLKQVSDQEHAEGARQHSIKVGGFGVDTTFAVLQVGPGDVDW